MTRRCTSLRPFGWRDLAANIVAVASAILIACFLFGWVTP